MRPEDALRRLARRIVVVDAIEDDAVAFCKRWGFIDTPDNPSRLYRTIADIGAHAERRSAERAGLRPGWPIPPSAMHEDQSG